MLKEVNTASALGATCSASKYSTLNRQINAHWPALWVGAEGKTQRQPRKSAQQRCGAKTRRVATLSPPGSLRIPVEVGRAEHSDWAAQQSKRPNPTLLDAHRWSRAKPRKVRALRVALCKLSIDCSCARVLQMASLLRCATLCLTLPIAFSSLIPTLVAPRPA